MKFQEIKEHSKSELEALLREKKAALVEARGEKELQQLKKHQEVSLIKDDIARILTRLKQLEKEEKSN